MLAQETNLPFLLPISISSKENPDSVTRKERNFGAYIDYNCIKHWKS